MSAPISVRKRFDYGGLARRRHHHLETKAANLGPEGVTGLAVARAWRLSQDARLSRPIAQSPTVYSCIRANSNAFSGIPRRVLLGRPDDDGEVAPRTDPLARLLDRPNRITSGRKLQRAMSRFLDMAGGVFLFMSKRVPAAKGSAVPGIVPIEPNEFPDELWPVREDLVEAVEDHATNIPTAWAFSSGRNRVEYPAHAVAHIYWPDDYDPLRGFGPLQAAWRAADHVYRAEAFDDALVEQGGQMGGYFVHNDRNLDPNQRREFEESVSQNMTAPSQSRRNLVLPAGVEFVPTVYKPKDMDATQLRVMKRKDIREVFGTPPVMLGELEDANRSSLHEQRRVYYENTIGPLAEFVEEELYVELILRLPEEFHNRWVRFDYSDTAAMREDLDAQIARMRSLIEVGVPVDLAAAAVGIAIEGVEEGERYLASGLRPLSIALQPPPDPTGAPGLEPEEEDDDEKEYVAIIETPEHRAMRNDVATKEAERVDAAAVPVRRAVRRAFDDYVLRQRKKLKEIAADESGSARASAPAPWRWYTESGRKWGAEAHAYAALMEMEPELGSAGWHEVRGISEDELLALVVENERDWGALLWSKVERPLRKALEDAARDAAETVGGSLVTATDPDVIQFLRAKEVMLKEGPMSVVAEQVKRALIEGMATVEVGGTLADRVRVALEELEDQLRALQERLGTRAEMIARTETASASNAARVSQYESAGVEQHEWASAGDANVRDEHTIDGEVAVVGDYFSNGLRFPGDPEGAPGNTINCRCTTVPVILE